MLQPTPIVMWLSIQPRVNYRNLVAHRAPSCRPRALPLRRSGDAPICDEHSLAPRELAQMVSEAIFDISRLVESTRHQRLDALLSGGPPE